MCTEKAGLEAQVELLKQKRDAAQADCCSSDNERPYVELLLRRNQELEEAESDLAAKSRSEA